MAIGGISQSTIPTYFDKTSSKLNGLSNNQILICNNYNGDRKNLIVVNEAAIDADTYDVETCYDNGWIVDFPTVAKGYREIYKIVLTGADYDVNQAGISVGKMLVRDKDKFTVKINGVVLDESHWDFLIFSGNNYIASPTTRTSSIILDSATAGGLVATDLIEVEYIEDITLGGDYNLKLYRSDGVPPRPYMIPKSAVIDGRGCYLHGATIIDRWSVDIAYARMDGVGTYNIEKRQCDLFRIAEFATGMDLSPFGLRIEVYKMQGGANSDGWAWSTRSAGRNMKLVYSTTINQISFLNFTGNGPSNNKLSGVYAVRVIDESTGGVSPILQTKISIRSFPVIETNESLSKNNCVGYYYTSKFV